MALSQPEAQLRALLAVLQKLGDKHPKYNAAYQDLIALLIEHRDLITRMRDDEVLEKVLETVGSGS